MGACPEFELSSGTVLKHVLPVPTFRSALDFPHLGYVVREDSHAYAYRTVLLLTL